jgi:hypothetical protein
MQTPKHDDELLGEATFAGSFVDFNQPDGLYPVECVGLEVEVTPNRFKNNEPQRRLVWHFIPAGYTGEGTFRWWTSFSTSPKSKLPATCLALGVPMPTPEQSGIRRSAFIGRQCLALIKHERSTKNPQESFPRIKDLLPAQRGAMSATA